MKTLTFPTIEKLVSVAVKGGHNQNDAQQVIAKSFEYLQKVYSESSARKLVEIAYVLY